jgi:hypothetical protein
MDERIDVHVDYSETHSSGRGWAREVTWNDHVELHPFAKSMLLIRSIASMPQTFRWDIERGDNEVVCCPLL